MHFPRSTVGRKIVMAISGLSMSGFLIVHLLGNSSIFTGPDGINGYAVTLHELGPLVWFLRLFMLILFSSHVFYGIQLTLENYRAKPQGYAVRRTLSATFAGKNMIWTGLVIGIFLVYHLLHFTFQVITPEVAATRHLDTAGRPDVYHMIVFSFQRSLVACVYLTAMIALVFHLAHGVQSSFQTLGLNNDRTLPVMVKSGTVAALVIFLGYIAIPLIILLGILKG